MKYFDHYDSPIGKMVMASLDGGLCGLWFSGQKYFPKLFEDGYKERSTSLFSDVKRWLDDYFCGNMPGFDIPLNLIGTDFQIDVWKLLCEIPFGHTTTYGNLAKQIAAKRGLGRMSAQAVGGAVGKNRISIIVPCHRVIGSDGSLTGYAGGLDKKAALLRIEHGNAYDDKKS